MKNWDNYSNELKEYYSILKLWGEEEADDFLLTSYIPEHDDVLKVAKAEVLKAVTVTVEKPYGHREPFIQIGVPGEVDIEAAEKVVIANYGDVWGEPFISKVMEYFSSEEWYCSWNIFVVSEDILEEESPVDIGFSYFADEFRKQQPQWESLDDEGVYNNFEMKVVF